MTDEIVIFDIDGTPADDSERIHDLKKKPKDWDAFFGGIAQDKAILSMVRLVIFYMPLAFTLFCAPEE